MINLGTILKRFLSLKAPASHPDSPLDIAALEQFNLTLTHVHYIKNSYTTLGVYLPSGLWVEGG